MRPSEALRRHRTEIRDLVSRYKTTNPRVFGSVVRGTDRDDSDLDLLVDALPGASLLDLGGLYAALEELLNVPIDLRTPTELPAKFRDLVLAEAQPV